MRISAREQSDKKAQTDSIWVMPRGGGRCRRYKNMCPIDKSSQCFS
jgi:hypothetical protein